MIPGGIRILALKLESAKTDVQHKPHPGIAGFTFGGSPGIKGVEAQNIGALLDGLAETFPQLLVMTAGQAVQLPEGTGASAYHPAPNQGRCVWNAQDQLILRIV